MKRKMNMIKSNFPIKVVKGMKWYNVIVEGGEMAFWASTSKKEIFQMYRKAGIKVLDIIKIEITFQ